MSIHEGDSVMHWTHGLGKVVRLEERAVSGEKTLYYAVQIGDMTVWVPADDKLETRLRLPTREAEFKRLMGILSTAGEPLPDDRHQRKTLLVEWLRDGRVESLFRVVRSLTTHRHAHPLNDNDQAILKRAHTALVAEWSIAMSIPVAQAEVELTRRLTSGTSGD